MKSFSEVVDKTEPMDKSRRRNTNAEILEHLTESSLIRAPKNISSREDYELAILTIIIQPIYSGMGKAKIEGEMTEDAEHWTDILFDVLPFERIADAWRRASRKKTNAFAPTVYEVQAAWYEIAERERQEREKNEKADRLQNPQKYCAEKAFHINEAGDVLQYFPEVDRDRDQIIPCRSCRKREHERERARLLGLYGSHEPLTKLKSDHAYKTSVLVEKKPPTALEIVQQRIDELRAEIREAPDEPTAENLKDIWQRQLNIEKYIYHFDALAGEIGLEEIENFKKRFDL